MPSASDLSRFHAIMEVRSRLLAATREFFNRRGYLEVNTPLIVTAPALEQHIDAQPVGGAYLRTSPELHMKRLVAAGYDKIFQIGSCFRRGEFGSVHNPEFCMLEWYRNGADYRDVLEETRCLLSVLMDSVFGRSWFDWRGQRVDLAGDWQELTVTRAFACAGWDPVACFDAARFEQDLLHRVEPSLPRDCAVALMDFPVQLAALAACREGPPPVAERWELYLAGLELANAFTELTDPAEQRRRFEVCARERRAAGRPVYPLDLEFLAALERGLPRCAGVALGIDRLLMLLVGATDFDAVLPFRSAGRSW